MGMMPAGGQRTAGDALAAWAEGWPAAGVRRAAGGACVRVLRAGLDRGLAGPGDVAQRLREYLAGAAGVHDGGLAA
jgi:hypothetical protein